MNTPSVIANTTPKSTGQERLLQCPSKPSFSLYALSFYMRARHCSGARDLCVITGRSACYDLDIKLNPEARVLTVWPQLVGLLGTD